ncbi:SRPBCC family protein [Salinimicrobium xinjiangense]|uniref:orotate phosphoribosyltransferase n=1 Tax=Salinimicrobium xinjiangense TaxID=438596 RepID=UPI00041FA61C|nr:orotate phosphoribosyltransferase [Salinimicrobium xinjiangense]
MELQSDKVNVNKSQQELFNFLTNVENYEQIMPESKEKFEVKSEDTFVFALKGMPEIALQIKETREPEYIKLGSTSDKFNFSLDVEIEPVDENHSQAQLFFHGKFNTMMAMMVKGPLKKFIGNLSENVAKL